ncbi:MAG: hypothetical protein ABI797_07805 [Chloroflexota bacterium]
MIDEAAREYILISLGLDRLEAGIVDSYYGPPELRDEAAQQDGSAPSLASRAAKLRSRLEELTDDAQRRDWLDRQLVAMETLAQRLDGIEMPYLEEVERCFDARPEQTPPEVYSQVRRDLDELLPGRGDLRARIDERDAMLTIPTDKLGATAEWLATELRNDAAAAWSVPDGDDLVISLVTNEPWSAYNWYDGNLRSRVEYNVDLPVKANQLLSGLAHETFPGHHLEHAWKEQRLVRERGYLEASVLLINTPEAYISEGLAEVGHTLISDAARWQELLLAICARAGIALDAAGAEREWRIGRAARKMRGSGGDAALQLHVAKRTPEEVVRFLEQDALQSPDRAAKSLDFISHPLWRTYIFCYAGGQRLLEQWCAQAGDAAAQKQRYFRLLTEQMTPSAVAAEMA